MRILFVTSEAHPLIKTGGLADVSAALPAALQALGHQVTLLIPAYPSVLDTLQDIQPCTVLNDLPMVGQLTILHGRMPDTGLPVMAVQHQALYQRHGNPYQDAQGQDWQDNPLRFATLSHVAAILASSDSPLRETVDIVHCNDWQTGLVPAYLHFKRLQNPAFSSARSLMCIHNLAFQGNCAAEWLTQLGLPSQAMQMQGLEFYGQMSFLKAGLFYADHLATVSPTYAEEIQTEAFGFGLQGLLQQRQHALTGILNGIDTRIWDPAHDSELPHHYAASDLTGKAKIKSALQQQVGLPERADSLLMGVVSRLTHQKGLDLVLDIAPTLLQDPSLQLVLLGSGATELEQGFTQLARDYPQQVACQLGYDETLAHRIMAGADLFIMPSRFEPCGLNQLYGLRYGTPPLVNHTGGLADSVVDTTAANLKRNSANGFVMRQANADELYRCIKTAQTYFAKPRVWKKIQTCGMALAVGWEDSAYRYQALYQAILGQKNSPKE